MSKDLLIREVTPEMLQKEFLPEEKQLIKLNMNHLMRMKQKDPNLSASDFFDFVRKAQMTGADPMLDQVYLVTHRTKVKEWVNGQMKEDWKTFGTTIFSYHFFLSKAEGRPQYDGYEITDGVGDYIDVNTNKISKQPYAEAKVYRKDRSRPATYKAWFPEFKKTTREGALNGQWSKSPIGMLRKCALCNALKQSFPHELADINVGGVDEIKKETDYSQDPAETFEVKPKPAEEEPIETKKEVKENAYKITFGKFKGKTFDECDKELLLKIYEGVKQGVQDRGRSNVSDEVLTFIDKAKEFLGV